MFNKVFLLVFLSQVILIKSQLTNDKKCKITDSACMVQTAQKLLPYFTAGISELDIPSLDIMTIDKMKIDFSGLHLNMMDVKVSGVKNAIIDDIKFDMQKKILHVDYHVDILVKSKYKASGNFLILPISGEGDLTMEVKNQFVKLHMPFEIEIKDGKSILKLKSHTFDFLVKGFIRFEFKNLFNGNKELSDALHKFMNENWKEVADVFGKPALEKPVSKIYKAIKTYIKSQPLEDLVLSY